MVKMAGNGPGMHIPGGLYLGQKMAIFFLWAGGMTLPPLPRRGCDLGPRMLLD